MNAIKKALSNNSDDKATPSNTLAGNAAGADSTAGSRTAGVTGHDSSLDSTRGATDATTGTHSSAGHPHHHKTETGTTGHAHGLHETNEFDPARATHSHTHLGHKTHETQHRHETEEVERVRDHERHITHVQHHVQPIKDEEHRAEVHHQRAIPQTHVEERHVSTDKDHKAFAGLNTHQDTVHKGTNERQVVDLGEQVNETTHHHVHNVIQPVIHKDTHEHHRIHTVIPTHHVTHEAPIVHQSVEHGILSKEDFLKQGGKLGSDVTHDQANVLATGKGERRVEGVGEELAQKLHLGGTHSSTTGATTGTTSDPAARV